MSHTPGPWEIEDCDEDGNLYENGVNIISNEGPVAFGVIDCSANLIAAAPELLAALKTAVESLVELAQYEDAARDMVDTEWFDDAVKAIAKAKGRPE